MKRIVPAVITMTVGWTVLLTYFWPPLAGWRYLLLELAVIVAASAMILGFLNVISFHARQFLRQRQGSFHSFVLLVSIVLVLLVPFADVALGGGRDLARQSVSGVLMTRVYEFILIPIQASLAALLPFFLGYAAYRTLRMRSARGALGAAVFIVTATLVLVGQVPLWNQAWLSAPRDWIVRVPATAGMRGILLGVALGVTATAVRVLIGADRPSSD